MDRRVTKTRNAMRIAFVELMQTTPWDSINIKMICDLADVSRSTFYTHFESKEDLLNFAFQALHQQLSFTNDERSIDTNQRFAFLPSLLDHVSTHCEIFTMHGSTAAGIEIFSRFRKVIANLAKDEVTASLLNEKLSTGDVEFIAGGIFSMLEAWNHNKCTEPTRSLLLRIDAIVSKYLA